MSRSTRTVLTSVVGARLLLATFSLHAEGSESLGGAHWSAASATGAAVSGTQRTILVVDRTGNARARAALEAFKDRWNAMRSERFAASSLPFVGIVAGRAADGCALPAAGSEADTGDVILCLDDTLTSAGVGGPLRVDAQKHTKLALVKLKSATMRWTECSLRTAVAHEMGHVMGLAHNDKSGAQQPSIMMSGAGPYKYGCAVWFNARDVQVLNRLYTDETPALASAASQAIASGAGR